MNEFPQPIRAIQWFGVWLLLGSAIFPLGARGQESPSLVLPPQPSQETFAYEVTRQDSSESASSGEAKLVKARISRTGLIREEEHHYTDGRRATYYTVGELMLFPDLTGKHFAVADAGDDALLLPFGKFDYVGFSWVSSENQAGPEELQGRMAMRFSQKIHAALNPQSAGLIIPFAQGEESLPADPVTRSAWLDLETGLPLQLQIGDVFFTLRPLPPPPGEIQISPAAREALRRYREVIDRLTSQRSAR